VELDKPPFNSDVVARGEGGKGKFILHNNGNSESWQQSFRVLGVLILTLFFKDALVFRALNKYKF
jgi:hypothetical protein